MKLEIIRDAFLNTVSLVERITNKHPSIPILSAVVFEVKKDMVVVKATNLDVGVEISVPAKVSEPGSFALSGIVLKSFLSNTLSKSVLCDLDKSSLKIKAGESEASINTLPIDDFPVIPKVSDGNIFTLDSKELLSGLKSVLWSASFSTIKPELGSVYIKEEGGDLVFVATDSFRLAEKKIKLKKPQKFEPVLIPFKNTLEIVRVFEDYVGDLKIAISKNQLSITTPSIHLSSRIVDGNFPDYHQIIPKEFDTKATILKQDLSSALKLMSSFSDSLNQVVISFNPKKKTVEVSTKNNELGESRQEIKGTVEGAEITMPFNHRYISDCLQSIDGESIVLKVAGAGKPLVISPASNNSFTYLVMSMNR